MLGGITKGEYLFTEHYGCIMVIGDIYYGRLVLQFLEYLNDIMVIFYKVIWLHDGVIYQVLWWGKNTIFTK